MEDKGLISSWTEEAAPGQQGPPRRKYRATGHGSNALRSWYEQMASGFSGLRLAGGFVVTMPFTHWSIDLTSGGAAIPMLAGIASAIFTMALARYLANTSQHRRAPKVYHLQKQARHYETSMVLASDREKRRLRRLVDGVQNELSVLNRTDKILSVLFGADSVLEILSPIKSGARVRRKRADREKSKRVRLAPGARVARLFRFLPPKMVTRRLDPMYRDFLDEYAQALQAGDLSRARVLRLWFYVGLFGIASGSMVGRALGHVFKEVRESLLKPSESS
jgi:hypothetical protein